MTPIVVYCGNGGDFEFEQERVWWRQWIEKNLPGCGPFVIKPHEQGDKAYIIFEAEKWNSVFLLKAPQYISHRLIADYEC